MKVYHPIQSITSCFVQYQGRHSNILSKKLTKSGVSIDRAGIAKIETGIRGVLDFELVALAKALNVKVTWLLGLKE